MCALTDVHSDLTGPFAFGIETGFAKMFDVVHDTIAVFVHTILTKLLFWSDFAFAGRAPLAL